MSSQDLVGTRAVALLLYMRSRAAGRTGRAAAEGGEGAGGDQEARLGRRRRTDSSASEHSANNDHSSGKFARRGESSASSTYERSYLKRERAVVEEEGEGPKRPRRLRVQEGAYKEATTRAKREPVEAKERRVRRCAMVPVGRETLKRMEGM